MKLTQFQTNPKLVIGSVVVIVLVLVVILTLSFGGKKTSSPTLTPTPTINPQKFIPPTNAPERKQETPNAQQIRKSLIQSAVDQKGEKVVFQADGYRIIYVPTPDIFFVQIFKDPVQTYRTQAQQWLAQKGLTQKDLCNLPLRILLFDPTLKKTNPNFNYFPNGCTP